jgi:2-polyprenyl-3-methyl-5-hydroxy-6-metoxy-1,4-benzoquinol methylase
VSSRVGRVGEKAPGARACPMCHSASLRVHFVYSEPPPLETRFPLTAGETYWRELHRCDGCGHFLESFGLDQSRLYSGEYVTSLYQDREGLRLHFDRINALPVGKSDNIGRARHVDAFARAHFGGDDNALRLLDVGAGLGVFPARMKVFGWDCTAIDMDERLAVHYRDVVGVRGLVADVRRVQGLGPFDLVTFNKVLEHVEDPVAMLASVARLLATGGIVYIELPDGEAAEIEGKEREEYLLGHMHVFSFASFALLIANAGFELLSCERLREPSTKFTLRGFARLKH